MDSLRQGWFTELSELWPGQGLSLQVEEVLYHEKSKFQDIMILKTKAYGNVLVLDGIIQCTPRDECAYQEMISLLAVNSHPNPEKVLIIGGGDGGVVRVLDKHPSVKEITMCEIDQKVVEVSKKYLPYMSSGFDSPKLNLLFADGFEFMGKHQGEFDIIITDSSDPIGPASSLFQKPYYELMKKALRQGGIISTQGECLWLHMDLIKEMHDFCKDLFPVVEYAYCTIPTYPSGQIGFALCSTNPETNFKQPLKKWDDDDLDKYNIKYYSTEIHKSSFVLPTFARKILQGKNHGTQNGTT